jgi:cation:H+ antiporter
MALHDSLIFNTLLVAGGLAMLYFGSEWLVRGSVNIAKKMQVSQLVIGLTIVAFGTSTPELVVSINAALSGQADISLGNVVGSNIVNIGLILGLSAAIFPLAVHINTIRREVPIMIGAALVLIILSLFDNEITQLEGVLLILAIIAFTYFSYKQSRKEEGQGREKNRGKTEQKPRPDTYETHTIPIEDTTSVIETASVAPPIKEGEKKAKSDKEPQNETTATATATTTTTAIAKSALLIAIGLALLYFGATLTVDNAVVIATSIGISERIVGLTIVAIGTSLPELITSVVAARKKHVDLSVGNIVGSNIFNALAIVGISAAIAGVSVNPNIFIDYAVMIAFSLVLIPLMRSGFVISRIEGYGLVAAYSIYLLVLLLM